MRIRLWLTRILASAFVALVLLLGVLSFNALQIDYAPEPPGPPAVTDINLAAIGARLSEAIRFETVSIPPGVPQDPATFASFHRFLERSYPRVHQTLDRETVNEFSLVFRWEGTDPDVQPILLIAHQDVVPATGDWTRPPFSGAIEDGFIWGRGSLDDKVSVLGLLEAVEVLIRDGFRPRQTVYLAFGHDEEIDGKNGAQAIAQMFRDRGIRFAFVLDEGSPIGEGLVLGIDRPVALIGTAEKGYLSVEIVARTSGGHSSIPSRASAMRVIGEALVKLWHDTDKGALNPPFTDAIDTLANEFGFVPRLVLRNQWLFEPLLVDRLMALPEAQAMISTTSTTTIIEAGKVDNMMPSQARTVINYRLLPGASAKEQLERIRRIIEDPDITVEQFGEANDPSPISDLSSDSFQSLDRTTRQVFPDALVAPVLVVAATDARHYVPVADQVFRFLPTRLNAKDLSRLHGVDERISIENYAEIVRFYAQLIRNSAE